MRRVWVSGAVLALAVLVGGAGLAPAPALAREAGKRASLSLQDVPLRSAIDALFRGSGMQFAVDPNVPNVPVTLSIRDVPLATALRLLIRQAAVAAPGLAATRDGDLWEIRLRSEPRVIRDPLVEEPGPEYDPETVLVWEKIPVQFNSVAVFALAFNGQMLPTEADVLLAGSGLGGGLGQGTFGGGGGYGQGVFGPAFGGGLGLGTGFGSAFGAGPGFGNSFGSGFNSLRGNGLGNNFGNSFGPNGLGSFGSPGSFGPGGISPRF